MRIRKQRLRGAVAASGYSRRRIAHLVYGSRSHSYVNRVLADPSKDPRAVSTVTPEAAQRWATVLGRRVEYLFAARGSDNPARALPTRRAS